MKNELKKPSKSKKQGPGAMQGVSRTMADVLHGNFLTRTFILSNLTFILYICFLMIVYISYGYYAERNVKELTRMQSELKDLKAEHLTSRSQLEKLKQQSQVARAIQALGLKESTEPPRVIQLETED